MNRPNALALGLSALIVGAVASQAGTPARRRTPPSTARRAYARADIPIRQGPAVTTPTIGTLGLGSPILVGDAALPGWLPIVREWIDENGARFSRALGYVAETDVTFGPPAAVVTTGQTAAATAPGRSDAGECDATFHFGGWPSQVDDFKARLNTVFDDTDAAVRGCAAMSAETKARWAAFLQVWRTFEAKPTATFGSYEDWRTTCTYAKQLDAWRDDTLAKAACAPVGPSGIHGYDLPAGVQAGAESLATIVKWGALTVGGTLLVATFYPEIRSALTALRTARARA